MFDEFLFTLGDFGKICLPQPYNTASFIFMVQSQIFQNFAYRGRIRKSSNLDRTSGNTGSPSSLYEAHKEHNMASNYKGLYGIFYKISMKVVKSENIR